MSQNTAGHNSDSPSFTNPIALKVVALALILISQSYFRRTFDATEIELPFQTQIALGAMPLVVLASVLLLTLVLKCWVQVRLSYTSRGQK